MKRKIPAKILFNLRRIFMVNQKEVHHAGN